MSLSTDKIRRLLSAVFNDEELKTFCFDHFPDVYEKFAEGMSKQREIHLLIEHCAKTVTIEKLLDQLKDVNPAQYYRFIYGEKKPRMKCCLIHDRSKKDQDIIGWFRDFLSAFPDLDILEDEIEERIKHSDFVCAVITRRGKRVTSAILKKVKKAQKYDRTIIAFVGDAVPAKDQTRIVEPGVARLRVAHLPRNSTSPLGAGQ